MTYLDACVTHGVAMSDRLPPGWTTPAKAKIGDAARKIPIVFSPDYSLGVNTVFKLLELAGKVAGQPATTSKSSRCITA